MNTVKVIVIDHECEGGYRVLGHYFGHMPEVTFRGPFSITLRPKITSDPLLLTDQNPLDKMGRWPAGEAAKTVMGRFVPLYHRGAVFEYALKLIGQIPEDLWHSEHWLAK